MSADEREKRADEREKRRHEGAKRHIIGVFGENNGNETSNFVGTNRDHVTTLIEELRQQFQQRLKALKSELVASKHEQQQVLASAMVKLPKRIKNMSVREFNSEFNCDLVNMVKAVREEDVSKKRDRDATETPSPMRQGGVKLQTASRTVRRGEAIL